MRVETAFAAPITMAPQRISDLVAELVANLADVDDDQPVIVVPIAFDPGKAVAQYRARYWIYDYADRGDPEGEVLRGVWYALQHEGVPWPLSVLYDGVPRDPGLLLRSNGDTAHHAAPDMLLRAADACTFVVPRSGLSWLNRMPELACRPKLSR